MDAKAKANIEARCLQSRQRCVDLGRLLPTTRPSLLRADFARKAIDLAIEHHSAIKGAGTWLHKFMHGGLLQLGRRGSDQMWSEREILTHLVIGDLFLRDGLNNSL
ncbi:hypothetical protein ACFQGW_16355 [Xanthomonas theicola]|uniref:hypothetical protein n=1 Tax=Xanthomonas theicola TaxID=56464 RepID=UPI000FF88A9E|nr:hypothetical protein [Xanthomonas theicola]QNH25891.1 hypothetical protein G4Q83_15545 [Xanthomonas theicola]